MAADLFESYLKGLNIHEVFLFSPGLETYGKWYRQLLAESIGKTTDDGTRVGIMPSIALGTTDLHSLGQLIFGGPRNRFTTFVHVDQASRTTRPRISDHSPFTSELIQGKEAFVVQDAILSGVQRAYRQEQLSSMTITLEALNEREMGALMGLHMVMVMCLAKLFSVNAFDQPAVERYKQETKDILTS